MAKARSRRTQAVSETVKSVEPVTAEPPALRQAVPVRLKELRPHPRNYKTHPEAQLEHIEASIRQFGFYRNVVVARDNTILAGHGVVQASARMGLEVVPVIRMDLDPESAAALKILALDNELGKFAETDDRALTELLREIREEDPFKLLGTGFDETQLAALLIVTRPSSEIADFDDAAEWVGMPEYDEGVSSLPQLVITFPTEDDRRRFCEEKKVEVDKTAIKGRTWSTRWPWSNREIVSGVAFTTGDGASTRVDPAAE